MFSAKVSDTTKLEFRITHLPQDVHDALVDKITVFTGQLWDKVVNEKLSGQVLNMRTGNLARSVRSDVTNEPEMITGTVFTDGSVPYDRIHEFGGTTKPHIILPKKASVLRFMMGGKLVFARAVKHPGSKMPVRSYLRSSLMEMVPEIVPGLREAVSRVLKDRKAA